MGVVNHGNTPRRPMKEKQAQADILRCIKHQVATNSFHSAFHWVASHQDKKKKWHDLTIREKINVIVDRLVKLVCHNSSTVNFPLNKSESNLKEGRKVTGSPRSTFMEYWSRRIARSFFHDKHILDWSHFNLVYWDGVEKVMLGFPQMFRAFVTKHVSKFCGTNRQLSRYDKSVQNVCPSCGKDDESATHITRCTEDGCREMLANSVDNLVRWMSTTLWSCRSTTLYG